MRRTFPLAVLLTASHGNLLCAFDDYRDFLDYMAGERVPLWDIGQFRRVVAEHIPRYIRQVPPPVFGKNDTTSKYLRQAEKQLALTEAAITQPTGIYTPRTLVEAFP